MTSATAERIVTLTDHNDDAQIAVLRNAERCARAQSPFEHDGSLWLISAIDVTASGEHVAIDGKRIA